MSKETTATIDVGFPLASILTIIFVIAKLAGKISWSWWWVFAPIWISTGLALTVIGFVLVIALLAAIFS